MEMPTQIFIHYFNPELLRAYGIDDTKQRGKTLLEQSIIVTKLAFIISELPLIVPASSIFENPYFKDFLEDIKPIIDIDSVKYISPTADIGRYAEKKIREFYNQPQLYPVYNKKNFSDFVSLLDGIRWQPRVKKSASKEISTQWQDELENPDGLWKQIIIDENLKSANISKLEDEIYSVPEKLDGRAFVLYNAQSIVPFKLNDKNSTRVNFLINKAFVESYIYEYQSSIIVDSPIGNLDCDIKSRSKDFTPTISFRKINDVLKHLGIDFLLARNTSWNILVELKYDTHFDWFSKTLIQHYKLDSFKTFLKIILNSDFQNKKTKILKSGSSIIDKVKKICLLVYEFFGQEDFQVSGSIFSLHTQEGLLRRHQITRGKSDIFLIQGRDSDSIKLITDFLASLGLNVIKWEEAVKLTEQTNPFILEVIEAGFAKATATIVLFTPDEEVKLKDGLAVNGNTEAGFQARPNVLLEAGMSLALFPKRTILIEMGNLRPVSDLSGLHTIRFDNSDTQKEALINRLEIAGCRIKKPKEKKGNDKI